MEISVLELWYTMGTVPKVFGIVGPLVAALTCAGGLRRPSSRWIVVLLGVASMAVPPYSLLAIRESMAQSSDWTGLAALSAGIAEALVTTPFAVAGGLAATLAWQSGRPTEHSRHVIYVLVIIGGGVSALSLNAMEEFTNLAASGARGPSSALTWFVDFVTPPTYVHPTFRAVGSSSARVGTASVDHPAFSSWLPRPLVGRLPVADDDASVAILSHEYWQAQGADPSAVGQTLVLDQRSYIVIGVLIQDMDRFGIDVWLREALVTTGSNEGATAGEPTVYFEFQVDKSVAQLADSPLPRYPDMLRSANVEGEVLVQFVVDANGQALPGSIKVLKSTHDLFTNSVAAALPRMRFSAAEVGGRKVPQLVQQPFYFTIR